MHHLGGEITAHLAHILSCELKFYIAVIQCMRPISEDEKNRISAYIFQIDEKRVKCVSA